MLRIPARGRHVSREPSVIAPHLLGMPLASFRRRTFAFLIDLFLFATLFGLQIVKLDGKPLSWWDAFGRSGGYGASAATAFLGFLEAIWHPNRQAIHDRICGTVVIRRPLRP